jgi:putative membrane protein
MRIIRSTASSLVLAASLVGANAWAGGDAGASGTDTTKGSTSTQGTTPQQQAQEHEAQNAMRLKPADERFLKDAFDHLIEGVAIGELAVRRGQSEEVKKIGRQIVTDDTAGLDKLRSVAEKGNLTLPKAPPPDQMKAVANLSKLTGKTFDDAFLAQVRTRDHNALSAFSQESKDGKNGDLKTYASDQVSVIRGQLDQIKTGVANMQKANPTNAQPPKKEQPSK